MKTFKTILLITGVLVAGLAFNTLAQAVPSQEERIEEAFDPDERAKIHEGKVAKAEYKREAKAVAKNNKREYKSRKHEYKDHKHDYKAAKRSFKGKSWKKNTR